MKKEFTILERVLLLQVVLELPRNEKILVLRQVDSFAGDLSFNEQEIKDYSLVSTVSETDPNIVFHKWDPECKNEKEIEVTESVEALIKDNLVKMDEKRMLTRDHYSLYNKFVEKIL
jgi:hypothetical protein